jgi:hypothetical protein
LSAFDFFKWLIETQGGGNVALVGLLAWAVMWGGIAAARRKR